MKQITRFSTGHFCIHGITGLVKNHRVSAWFDSAGNLLDAEAINPQTDSALPIPGRWRFVRGTLEAMGRLFYKDSHRIPETEPMEGAPSL